MPFKKKLHNPKLIAGQPIVLTAEEFANLTQQNSVKCAIEAKAVPTQKLVQSISSRSPSNHYSKPILTCSSPPSGIYDGDVCKILLYSLKCVTLIHLFRSTGESIKTATANDKKQRICVFITQEKKGVRIVFRINTVWFKQRKPTVETRKFHVKGKIGFIGARTWRCKQATWF